MAAIPGRYLEGRGHVPALSIFATSAGMECVLSTVGNCTVGNLTSAAVTPNLSPWKYISTPSRPPNWRDSPAIEDETRIRWRRKRLAAIWRKRPAFSTSGSSANLNWSGANTSHMKRWDLASSASSSLDGSPLVSRPAFRQNNSELAYPGLQRICVRTNLNIRQWDITAENRARRAAQFSPARSRRRSAG